MLTWCALLFVLGLLAFADAVLNMGEIFRQVNSLFFLLISLGLLIRTTTKAKSQKHEKLQDRVFDLEKTVQKLKKESESAGSYY